ncbi:MAG TPA: tripartite tricarboxylate transporter substrate-binding protein [Bradyrhizobium sp.]|nr:tripartite tricarboxylate transporter substrate-binding protein [Bradyrhizobium sp.]
MKPFLAVALVLFATDAAAQSYPSRPITIIAPTTAGGPPDTIARLLSEPMRAVLGQPVIVENVTGAGSTLGLARVVRAAPDGYTLSIGHLNSHVFSSLTYPVNYDVVNDFEPISLITIAPMALFGRSGLPGENLKELVAWLKDNPDKASFGSVGLGGPARVWATHFQNTVGTRLQFVPYRGAFAAVQDLIGGQIDLSASEASNVAPHVRGGKLKVYAMLSNSRWPVAPEIPTIEETGVPGLQMPFWHGLWAPKGTPPDVIAKLNEAVTHALADPTVRARLQQMGQEIYPREQRTPQALALHQGRGGEVGRGDQGDGRQGGVI